MTIWDCIFQELFQCRFSTGATRYFLLLCIPTDSPPFRNASSLSKRCNEEWQFSVDLVLQSRPCLGLPCNMVTMHDWFVSPVLAERWFPFNFRWPLAG